MEKALENYLRRYADLNANELESIRSRLEPRQFRKREVIVAVGQKEEYLNLVVKGLARKFFINGKHEIITQMAKEGELISSSVSFFSGEPSEYVVEAIEPLQVLSLSRQNIDELLGEIPKMERIWRLMATEFYLEKEKWEQELVQSDIRERFVDFMQSNADLVKRVPQKYIASYLNIQPETFSRLKYLLKNNSTLTE